MRDEREGRHTWDGRVYTAGGMCKPYHPKCHIKSCVIKKQSLTCSVNHHVSQTAHCRREPFAFLNFCLFRNVFHDQNPLQFNKEVEVPTLFNTHKTTMRPNLKLQMEWAGLAKSLGRSEGWSFKSQYQQPDRHFTHTPGSCKCYIPGHSFVFQFLSFICLKTTNLASCLNWYYFPLA